MPEALIRPSVRHIALLVALLPSALAAQRVAARAVVTMYGDNTEFFTPYRTGETLLGGQVAAWLDASPEARHHVRVGVFADHRFGSDRFADSVKPVIAYRYQATRSLGVIGTLDAARRHGLHDAIMVSTREITSPVEYGLQWVERRRLLDAEAWVNWQRLNTSSQREQFEMGFVAAFRPVRTLAVSFQHLWSHRGGQLHDAGVPVSNNRVTALGLVLRDSLPHVGVVTLRADRLWSDGNLDPDTPQDRPARGRGTLLKASIAPPRVAEFFVLYWSGRNFSAAAGDPNYGSAGEDPDFYRAGRRYVELGAVRRTTLGSGISLDGEVRWHRIDSEPSIAFFGTPWELSYRIMVRVPLAVEL